MIKILSIEDIIKISNAAIQQLLTIRANQIYTGFAWDADSEGYMVVVESSDNIQDDYLFIGNQGLVTDTFDEAKVGEEDFASPFEFIDHHVKTQCYELYLQCNDEVGVVFILPDAVVNQHPDLQQLIASLQDAIMVGKRL